MPNLTTHIFCTIFKTLLFCIVVTSHSWAAEQGTVELRWDDLVPADFSFQSLREQIDYSQYDLDTLSDQDTEAQRLYDDMTQLLARAPVVEQFDGVNVELSGFVVPLEMEEDRVLTFLLVPYFGACIHTPPPPSNQIVYVETQGGFELPSLDEPMTVIGTLMIERHESEIGSAGYTLYAGQVKPFL